MTSDFQAIIELLIEAQKHTLDAVKAQRDQSRQLEAKFNLLEEQFDELLERIIKI